MCVLLGWWGEWEENKTSWYWSSEKYLWDFFHIQKCHRVKKKQEKLFLKLIITFFWNEKTFPSYIIPPTQRKKTSEKCSISSKYETQQRRRIFSCLVMENSTFTYIKFHHNEPNTIWNLGRNFNVAEIAVYEWGKA